MKRLLGECCRSEGEGLWSSPREVPEKGLHICLGWGGGVCPQRHRPMRGATGNAWFILKWSSSPRLWQGSHVPVRLTLACRRAAPASPRMSRAWGNSMNITYLGINLSNLFFETCKVAFLDMPMIILQPLNISVSIKSKIKYSPEGQEI